MKIFPRTKHFLEKYSIFIVDIEIFEIDASEILNYQKTRFKKSNTKRIKEYIAGRACGEKALVAAGCKEKTEINTSESGAPIAPKGYLVSISHNNDLAVSIASKKGILNSIGIDIENINETISEDTFKFILSGNEIKNYKNNCTKLNQKILKLVVFTAKESSYKTISALTNDIFPISEIFINKVYIVEKDDNFSVGNFNFKFTHNSGVISGKGYFFIENGYILSVTTL